MKALLHTIVILFICLTTFTNALIVHKQWYLKQGYVSEIQRFGFEAGGQLTFTSTIAPDPEGAFLFLCSSPSFYVLLNTVDSGYTMCKQRSVCEASFNLSIATNTFTIEHPDYFHMLLVNCHQNADILVTAELLMTNPEAGQLSRGDEPLPMIFGIAIGVWVVLTALWVTIWIVWRNNSTALHGIVLVTFVLKILVVALAFSYWNVLSRTGYALDGIRYAQIFGFAVSETSFFILMLLVAKGWKITRTDMSASEMRTVIICIVLLLGTLLFFSFYSEGYYFLSLLIMYFFMIPKIFGSLRRNIAALQQQYRIVNYRLPNDPSLLLLQKRMMIFQHLKRSIVVYLLGILVVNGLKIAIVWYRDYVNYIMDASLSIVMNGWIAYLLLPLTPQLFAGTLLLDRSAANLDHDDLFGESASLLANSHNEEPQPEPIDIQSIMVFELPSSPASSSAVAAQHLVLGIQDRSPDLAKFN